MKSDTTVLFVILIAIAGCRTDPRHPTGADVLPKVDGDIVATVDGHSITAKEAAEFAATREAATLDGLVRRERRARLAIERGVDVEFARKRAMVRSFLDDEIEASVQIDAVPATLLQQETARAEAELRGFSGFEVTSVRVGAMELLRGDPPSKERSAELTKMVTEAADRLYASVPEADAVGVIEKLEWQWLDPALRVERQVDVKVLDADDPREPPAGWVRANRLATELGTLEDGERSTLFHAGNVPVFAVRKARVEADPVDEAQLAEIAQHRALAQVRRERLDELLETFRARTALTFYEAAIEEQQ